MPELFFAEELVDIAIREEVTGATYYRAVAERAESRDLKEFATRVARMEDEHAEQFRRLLGELSGQKTPPKDYDGEYGDYLAYLVGGRIFPMGEDGAELARRQESDLQAVETAAGMEKNTLLLYGELMQFVPEAERFALRAIMDEERQHLLQLARFREQLMA